MPQCQNCYVYTIFKSFFVTACGNPLCSPHNNKVHWTLEPKSELQNYSEFQFVFQFVYWTTAKLSFALYATYSTGSTHCIQSAAFQDVSISQIFVKIYPNTTFPNKFFIHKRGKLILNSLNITHLKNTISVEKIRTFRRYESLSFRLNPEEVLIIFPAITIETIFVMIFLLYCRFRLIGIYRLSTICPIMRLPQL